MSVAVSTEEDTLLEYQENLPNIKEKLFKFYRTKVNRQLFLNTLPILTWLPKYQKSYFLDDLVAGVTVALTAIPQGIANAAVAGLEPQYGLYASFMGSFVYIIFGSCKDVTIGVTSIMSSMIQPYVLLSTDFAVFTAFFAGVIVFLLGLFNLGFIVQFISIPVTHGFVTAAAIQIASGQVKSLLGYGGPSNDFVESISNFIKNVSKTKLWDSVLGLSSIFVLCALKQIVRIKCGGVFMKTFLKYIALARNCIVVVLATLLAYILANNDIKPFSLVGTISSQFPEFKPPPFATTTVSGEYLNFGGMLKTLGTTIIMLPLISILDTIAIAKAFSKGKLVNASQEMIALGLCNAIGSFVSSMPITTSFTRTALNNASGVRTPLGGLYTGVIVLLALGFLTSTFAFIPRATLAAIIIVAMWYMVEFEAAIEIWRVKKIDIIPFIVTVVACLGLGLEIGILIGIGVNIVFVLYLSARPKSKFEVVTFNDVDCLIITPDQSLIYTAAEYFRNQVLRKSFKHSHCDVIIINGEAIQSIDVTAAKNLEVVANDLRIQNKQIFFWQWNIQPIGVAYRLNTEFGKLFSKVKTDLNEIIDNKIDRDV